MLQQYSFSVDYLSNPCISYIHQIEIHILFLLVGTLEDIKGIDVQRSDKSDIDDDNFDEDGEIVSQDELIGIKTAVFKGSSIRDTGIVKKFEKQGFYFISMRFM